MMRRILISMGLAVGLAACEPAEETEPTAEPMPAGPVDDAVAPEDLPPDDAIPAEEEVPEDLAPPAVAPALPGVDTETPVMPPMPADPDNPVG